MQQSSCAVADSLAQVGVETGRYAVFGSGLLTGFDWQAEIARILRTQHPNAVIAVFVGNYVSDSLRDGQGSPVVRGSPEFFALWQQRAVSFSATVRAAGAQMFWVSPPTAPTPTFMYAQRLYEGYQTIPGDRTIDAGRVLVDAAGHELLTKTTCGSSRVLRTPDGHLTPDGARIYGQEIAHEFTGETGLITSPRPC